MIRGTASYYKVVKFRDSITPSDGSYEFDSSALKSRVTFVKSMSSQIGYMERVRIPEPAGCDHV